MRAGRVAKANLRLLAPPVLALLLLALAVVLAVSVGSVHIPVREVLQAVGRGVLADPSTTHDTIIWQVRLAARPHSGARGRRVGAFGRGVSRNFS